MNEGGAFLFAFVVGVLCGMGVAPAYRWLLARAEGQVTRSG